MGRDQVTDLATEEYHISLPWETLGLVLQYDLSRALSDQL